MVSDKTGSMQENYLHEILSLMVAQKRALWEPLDQTQSALICWHPVNEWGELVYNWVRK